MRAIIIAAIALLMACALAAPEHQQWEFFKATHKKVYKSLEEEAYRRSVFDNNMKKASELELRNPQAKFGATPYADMTEAEFKIYHSSETHYEKAQKEIFKTPFAKKYSAEEIASIPQSVDWRTKGLVTPVKNQANCGSCWAFSTTGGIEGQWAKAGNTLTSLSEQELVSCDTIDNGCGGGLMSNAYNWLLENHGGKIVTEESYPYVSGGGNVPACTSVEGKTVGAQISGHLNVYHDEEQMSAWTAANGPLSIAVDAGVSWQLYFGGVITDCSQGSLDHGVLIVGYTDRNGTGAKGSYWIVKNSWGPTWGEEGYIYLAKGSNQCSITQYPVSSVVGPAPPTATPATPEPGYFVHAVYDDQNCTIGEWDLVWKQGECISWDGVSFKAVCAGDSLKITAYYQSLDCTGKTKELTEDVNKCAESTKDDVYYNTRCPAAGEKLKVNKNAKAMKHFAKLYGKK